MVRGYTTVEQSKRLLSLGLDPNSADMYYFLDPTPSGNIYHLAVQRIDMGVKNLPKYSDGDLPCWSLAALLELIPMTKMCHYDLYYCQYIEEGKDFPIYSTAEYNNSIDAAFEMVCWLIEYGYIKVNN